MKGNFEFDKEMLMPAKFLLRFLKEECSIDLSSQTPGTVVTNASNEDNASNGSLVWDIEGLNHSISTLFGNNSVTPFGYAIRLMTEQQRANDITQIKQKKLFETV